MMRFTAFVAAGICAAFIVPPRAAAQEYDAGVSSLVSSIAKSIGTANKHSVAVLEFTDLRGQTVCLGQLLAEDISIGLVSAAQGLEVVTRSDAKLKAVLAEQKLGASGMIDPQSAAKVAQLLGVQALLTGTINMIGDRVRITTTLVDSTTARLVGGATTSIPRTKTIDDFVTQCGAPPSVIETGGGGRSGKEPPTNTSLAESLRTLPCTQEGSIRSERYTGAASFTLVNLRSRPVQAYWLGYDGERKRYRDINANETTPVDSFLDHVFLFMDETGQHCLGIYVVAGNGGRLELKK